MLTAVYKKVRRGGYVAWIEEIPGVLTQGATRAVARENLEDALREFLAARRSVTKREALKGSPVTREHFAVV